MYMEKHIRVNVNIAVKVGYNATPDIPASRFEPASQGELDPESIRVESSLSDVLADLIEAAAEILE